MANYLEEDSIELLILARLFKKMTLAIDNCWVTNHMEIHGYKWTIFQGIQYWKIHAMGGQYFLYLLGLFLFFQYQTAKHLAEKKPNISLNQLHTQPKILASILK